MTDRVEERSGVVAVEGGVRQTNALPEGATEMPSSQGPAAILAHTAVSVGAVH